MSKQRNYGIDLLRVVLMILIITGHLFVHTNIRNEVSTYSSKWLLTWIYQTVIVCAVNCFILITGYFSNVGNHSIKVKRIALLYGQVLFYSVAIYAILVLTGTVSFSFAGFVHSIFPVVSGQYWFFSSYILLMLLMPFLNVMLSHLNDYYLKFLNVIILIIFYFLPMLSIVFMQFDPTEGMGIIGFVSLYVIGYTLKRFKFEPSKSKCALGLVINCTVVFISKILLTYLVDRFGLTAGTGLLYHYNTVFQLINAVFLLLLFKQINLKNTVSKIVGVLGSSVFGVYLIHEHPGIRSFIWSEKLFNTLVESSFFVYLGLILFIPFIVFLGCLVIDKARRFVCGWVSKNDIIKKIDAKLVSIDCVLNSKFSDDL